MKRILLLVLLFILSMTTFADDSNYKVYMSPDDNVTYRLFKTSNIHIFIKLNTKDGTMKMVQFSTDSLSDQLEVDLSSKKLAEGVNEKNGRFFLYPTSNMYTFLLLDQIDGRVWQVQWSTEASERGLWQIK